MGLEMISFNVQSFSDQNNVIEDLGIDNISQIKKGAAIAKAQADRDIAISQAQAAKEANDAKVQADMEIAEKQTSLAIRQAELKQQSDVKKAEADAAYKIQEQEQRKTIEITSANANIAKAEREAELKAREVEVRKQTLDAEIRAKADAERYRQEQEAQAALFKRQKEAEARRYEQEQAAAAEMKIAEAQKYAKEQEAEGIAAVGRAEAEAIRAKALAEAEGIDKKAEAMKKYGEAAVVEMIMGALPEIARNVAEPLSKVDKITMYGEGNSAKLIGDIVNSTTQITEGISAGMGIDLKSILLGALGGKLANQIMIAGTLSGVCEALAYARDKGLNLSVLLDSLSTGAAGSKQLDAFGEKIIRGDYAPGFFLKHFVKDMTLAQEEASRDGLALEVLSQALVNYKALEQEGWGDLGTQALIKHYEADAPKAE